MRGSARSALVHATALLVLSLPLGLTMRALVAMPAAGAAVAWPPSPGLVIGEVLTRGAGASDQYAELYNAAAQPAQLGGLELDYVTASGATTTIKQAWSELSVPAGGHVLVANAAGSYASIADGTFSGGFSTSGGTLVLRRSADGGVVDALSWGSAANSYVEGSPAPAPSTGSSVERLPGAGANWVDTNDNAADAIVQPAPLAQNLAATPQPRPAPSATPTAPACGTAPPPPPSEAPSPTASEATSAPSDEPTPTTTPSVAPSPTTAVTPTPFSQLPIAQARAQPPGATVAVAGTVTVAPGWILGDTTLAVEDASAGIFVRLPAVSGPVVAPGDTVEVSGVLAAPYGNSEIRPGNDGFRVIGHQDLIAPRDLDAGQLGEATEGLLARLVGTVDSVSAGSSGSVTVMLSDASGAARIFLYDTLGVVAGDFVRGERLSVTGLVGDRLGLYRLWPPSPADIVHLGLPTPTPPAGTTPSPSAQDVEVVTIAQALKRAGETVTVEGTVSVRTGLLDADGRRVTIQDSSAAVLVRLPDSETTAVGDRIRVTGSMGTYYGAPQLAADSLAGLSRSSLTPLVVRAAPLPAALEWRLITVAGEISAVSRDGDSWHAELAVAGGSLPVSGLSRGGIPVTALQAGRRATITGIVKRAYPTATDQRFALVPRGPGDIVLAGGGASPDASQGASPGASTGEGSGGTPPGTTAPGSIVQVPATAVAVVDLGEIGAHMGDTVLVGGRVETAAGNVITLSDASGQAVVLLSGPAGESGVGLTSGTLLNVLGVVVVGPGGLPAIAVTDPAAVTWLAQPVAAAPSATPASSAYWLRATVDDPGGPPPPSGQTFLLVPLAALLLVGAGLLALAHPRIRTALRSRVAGARAAPAETRAPGPQDGAG